MEIDEATRAHLLKLIDGADDSDTIDGFRIVDQQGKEIGHTGPLPLKKLAAMRLVESEPAPPRPPLR